MGRVAELLSFERTNDEDGHGSEAKCDPGGGDVVLAPHFSAPGDDTFPVPGVDYVALEDSAGSGCEQAVGYADVKNEPKSQIGEKRIYARDASGTVKGEIHLKNDGTIVALNAGGTVELSPEGNLTINGGKEQMVLGTTQKTELTKMLQFLTVLKQVIGGAPIPEAGMGGPSGFQTALNAATAALLLPTDLERTVSQKHKLDG